MEMYKTILFKQLRYINEIAEDIYNNLSSETYTDLFRYVMMFVHIEDEYAEFIRINLGEVYAYIGYDRDRNPTTLTFDMGEVGLNSCTYKDLVLELHATSEKQLSKTEFYHCYKEFIKGKKPFVLNEYYKFQSIFLR